MSNRDESRHESVSIESVRVLCVDGDRSASLRRPTPSSERTTPSKRSVRPGRAMHSSASPGPTSTASSRSTTLPDADGLALLDAVRADDEACPFVLFTGTGSEAIASEAISAGITDYLRRDATEYATLAETVRTAVETARADLQRQRQLRAIETARGGSVCSTRRDGSSTSIGRTPICTATSPPTCSASTGDKLYPDDKIEHTRDVIIPTVMAEGDWYGETTGLRSDGSTFVEAHSLSTTGDGDLICTVQDVTDEKERERDLERYETIIDALGDPVYTVDAEGRYAFVNDAYAEMTGYEKDEIVGQDVSVLLDEPSVERGTDCVRSLLSDATAERKRTYEITVETSDGRTIRCEDHCSLLPIEDGQYRGVAGVVRDITERTARERELELDETILETIPDEVYALDEGGTSPRSSRRSTPR